MRRRITVYNESTGEVIEERDHPITKGLILANRKSRFCKLEQRDPQYKTEPHLARFYKLLKFLEMHTNRLVYRRRSAESWFIHEPLTPDDITRELGLKRTNYFLFMRESREAGIIRHAKIDDETYGFFINPAYVTRGNGMTPELYTIFKDDKVLESLLTKTDRALIRQYFEDIDDDD